LLRTPGRSANLTIKRNTVAVVTDGSAVLGLGEHRRAGLPLPVMEGKAALFKRFRRHRCVPHLLDTQDVDEIVAAVKAIGSVFAVSTGRHPAPRCFEVEARLRAELDIPVFHDDQHGDGDVAAAVAQRPRVYGKKAGDVKIVQSGAGAAGTAILKLLIEGRCH